ncbi:uncharacterized protein LOC129975989 [Argiope bruennichi]|uniref:NADH dehydrogenase [ubiquinone] flavoprotein 3, mitochondrial n=1 Tax=Argiope bruennichi TaxID=94029 RepID=A0A8T0ES23_ARGBR|nr:uncharacterized protein LOC129975989 [Argiope bruennichi]KAF8778742.1 hypothetical protein HNY73_015436 [Argiope bruennichi]
MACNLLRQVGKSSMSINNGMLYAVRMCNKDVSRGHSAGQSSQSQEASYGAPEYYQYNEYSFNDINIEMDQLRLPRPSSKTPKDKK